MDIKKIINNFVEAHTDEIETAIRSALSEEKSINEIKAGDHFEYKGIEWVCLDIGNETAFAVTAKVIANMPFNDEYEDGCNNWRTSSLRKWLNSEFLDKNYSPIWAKMQGAFARSCVCAKNPADRQIMAMISTVSLKTMSHFSIAISTEDTENLCLSMMIGYGRLLLALVPSATPSACVTSFRQESWTATLRTTLTESPPLACLTSTIFHCADRHA